MGLLRKVVAGPRRVAGACVVASLTAACTSQHSAPPADSRSPVPHALSWCNQQLAPPSYTTWSYTKLGIPAHPGVGSPASSTLPKTLAAAHASSLSGLFIVSSDCQVGDVVIVTTTSASAMSLIGTVAVAHNRTKTGITALLLGRRAGSDAAGPISGVVHSYRGGREVGEAQFDL